MKKIIVILSVCVGILIACLIAVCSITGIELAKYEAMTAEQEVLFEQELNDAMISDEWYKQDGYDDLTTWWNDLIQQKENLANIASETFDNVGDYFTQEQKDRLTAISEEIQSSHSLGEITALTLEAESIEAEALVAKEEAIAAAQAEKAAKKSSNTQTVKYNTEVETLSSSEGDGGYSGGYYDFMRDGVVYAYGYRFTYYSQSVLPGGGLNIPGRHVEGGFVKDGDGYIVAATGMGYGTTGPSPWGTWKSYDTGVSGNTVDIYVA